MNHFLTAGIIILLRVISLLRAPHSDRAYQFLTPHATFLLYIPLGSLRVPLDVLGSSSFFLFVAAPAAPGGGSRLRVGWESLHKLRL